MGSQNLEQITEVLRQAVAVIGPGRNEGLDAPLYDFVRRYQPMICIDVVLVPESEEPSVILAKRGTKAVAPGQWWIFGGRVDKNLHYMDVAQAKTKSEIGLDVTVKPSDIIGLGRNYFMPDPLETSMRDHNISTPNLCFAKQVPLTEQALAKINPADGHEANWHIFRNVCAGWHPYIINAVAYAWQRLYGKKAVEYAPRAKRILADPVFFIPLRSEE